ncbi:MAG: hypothetical protein RSE43_05570 [Oscillospiraceae bacterium]
MKQTFIKCFLWAALSAVVLCFIYYLFFVNIPTVFDFEILVDDNCEQTFGMSKSEYHLKLNLLKEKSEEPLGVYTGKLELSFDMSIASESPISELVKDFGTSGKVSIDDFKVEMQPFDSYDYVEYQILTLKSNAIVSPSAASKIKAMNLSDVNQFGDTKFCSDFLFNLELSDKLANCRNIKNITISELTQIINDIAEFKDDAKSNAIPCSILILEDNQVIFTIHNPSSSEDDLVFKGKLTQSTVH